MEAVIQRSFAGGELAPALHARADQVKYVTGLRTCRNFFVRREGGVSNRAGTRFVRACKTNSATVQILRYESEVAGESLLIENGNGYFRFYKNGALVTLSAAPPAWSAVTTYAIGDLVVDGGINYYSRQNANLNNTPAGSPNHWYAMPAGNIFEIPWPGAANLPYWHQNGRVITLTSNAVAPHELIFVALTTWIIQPVSTLPWSSGPTGLSFTPGGAGTRTYAYAVTAAAANTYEESLVGSTTSQNNVAEPTEAAPHVLTWMAVAGAVEYYVYADPYGNGVYGFIGTSTGASFRDAGFVPDFAVTPPIARQPFANSNQWPAVSAHYQQRRLFGNQIIQPDAIHGSRPGFPSNFAIESPLQDDDAILFRLTGTQFHPVRHMFGLRQLVVMTDGGVWTVGQHKVPLVPQSIPAEQEGYVGVASVRPVVHGNRAIYVQKVGKALFDLRFDQEVEGLGGKDLTIYASHLFRGVTITEMDFQLVPDSIVWCVRSDGVLLGLTYIPEHDVWGWHRHDTAQNATAAKFEHVCVVREAAGDVPYVIVQRTIGGQTVRYIEKLLPRDIVTFDTDAIFMDASLSYSGAPVTSVSGLDHLNGQIVAVVADGDVIYNGDPAGAQAASFIVSSGVITLPGAKSNVHVGLRYKAQIETLDLDVQGSAVRDKKKRIGMLDLLIELSSRTFSAGPDASNLKPFVKQSWESTEDAHTGRVNLNVPSQFSDAGRVFIEQSDPLPLTVLAVIPHVEMGG